MRRLVMGLLVLLAACSGKSSPIKTVDVQGAEMKFIPNQLTLTPGKYTFHFKNVGSTIHELAIIRNGEPLARGSVGGGGTLDLQSVKLETGTYQMFCGEPGHAAAGMTGTINVR